MHAAAPVALIAEIELTIARKLTFTRGPLQTRTFLQRCRQWDRLQDLQQIVAILPTGEQALTRQAGLASDEERSRGMID
jgi:hypothetical protein